MSSFSNSNRPSSIGEAFIQGGNFGDGYSEEKSNIIQANTVKFEDIFKYYEINIDEFNKKTCCPFKFHTENSPSFAYYPETNSFFCFGCKNGGGPVNFVSLIEDISKHLAANKLLKNFYSEKNYNLNINKISEQKNIYLLFSKVVREFIQLNKKSKEAIKFIDKITFSFDTLTQKHSIDNDGLKLLTDKLILKIEEFKCRQL